MAYPQTYEGIVVLGPELQSNEFLDRVQSELPQIKAHGILRDKEYLRFGFSWNMWDKSMNSLDEGYLTIDGDGGRRLVRYRLEFSITYRLMVFGWVLLVFVVLGFAVYDGAFPAGGLPGLAVLSFVVGIVYLQTVLRFGFWLRGLLDPAFRPSPKGPISFAGI